LSISEEIKKSNPYLSAYGLKPRAEPSRPLRGEEASQTLSWPLRAVGTG
jgi:hypothetical protein